jgi:stringent starvation protein B
MTSNKPYLIRALYEWLLDNSATPYIMVDTTRPQVEIPPGIDKDGQVVLNIAPRAVQALEMENEYIAFSARFSGASQNLYIPMGAVMAIYSMEDGEGMMFAEPGPVDADADGAQPTDGDDTPPPTPSPGGKPGLKIVK